MPIDPTKPVDGTAAVKAELRANLQAILDAIAPKILTDAGTAITINSASFGDSQLIVLRCTAATAVTVTGADDVPAGRMLQAVQKGAGTVTIQATAINKPASLSFTTSEQHESLVAMVEVNDGGASASWLLI